MFGKVFFCESKTPNWWVGGCDVVGVVVVVVVIVIVVVVVDYA